MYSFCIHIWKYQFVLDIYYRKYTVNCLILRIPAYFNDATVKTLDFAGKSHFVTYAPREINICRNFILYIRNFIVSRNISETDTRVRLVEYW